MEINLVGSVKVKTLSEGDTVTGARRTLSSGQRSWRSRKGQERKLQEHEGEERWNMGYIAYSVLKKTWGVGHRMKGRF